MDCLSALDIVQSDDGSKGAADRSFVEPFCEQRFIPPQSLSGPNTPADFWGPEDFPAPSTIAAQLSEVNVCAG